MTQSMPCDLCGKDTQLCRAIVEGTELNVCASCAKMGKLMSRPQSRFAKRTMPATETIEILISGFGKKIRDARERKGLTQKEFAAMLNEKESIIQKIENETFKPTIEKAKRFEKILGIKLIGEEEATPVKMAKDKSGPLTIGDLIKVK
ncbi:multiprotein-bridging factor 1 family protein [Candidatus Woesearchaeota archaeon]|nr:multiprotein-bridging factor 1 family protein [Candidatus Woesearchaeota archaeon]